MQGKKQRERYRRLDRAERAAIQSGLDKGRSCRQIVECHFLSSASPRII